MISTLRYTLVADGTSDRALMPILRWTLLRTGTSLPLAEQWADPAYLSVKGGTLVSRLQRAVDFYPCDLLFIHRDAEGQEPDLRYDECSQALADVETSPPAVVVVPVRMTEAWLLTSVTAIRKAADNPHGRASLTLPPLHHLENTPDPKQKLQELLRTASEAQGRRLERFRRDEAARRLRVAELTEDFSPLLSLPAFQRLLQDTQAILRQNGWL